MQFIFSSQQQVSDECIFPEVFEKLKITKEIIELNIRKSSYLKAVDMFNGGHKFELDKPTIEGRNEIVWRIKSQYSSSANYLVKISPRILMSHKNMRNAFRNFNFKCSCEDFEALCH